MHPARVLLATLLLAGLAPAVLAHDMWLEPSRYFQKPGEQTPMHLLVGERLTPEEEVPIGMPRVTRLELAGPGGVTDLRRGKGSPLTLPKEGTYVLGMERIPAGVELPAEKFNTYLEEEGHFDAVRERMAAGEYDGEVVEVYTRHLKTIVQSGARPDDSYRHVFGMKLEIVPITNPAALKAGGKLEFRILFDGKPLSHARVSLFWKEGDKKRDKISRTATDGTASFTVEKASVHLLRVTHLRRCECDDADYESFWAALSFAIR